MEPGQGMQEKNDHEGITTEAQLEAAIEAGLWYDSDSEAGEELDQETSSQDLYEEVDWRLCYWNTSDQLISVSPPPVISIGSLLDQIKPPLVDTVDGDTQDDPGASGNEESSTARSREQVVSVYDHLETPREQVVSVYDHLEGYEESLTIETPGGQDEINISASERPKHYSIAHEILTSERSYVQSVRLLEKVVHGAIKTAFLTKRPILPEQARKEIFLNIGEIYALNFDLLQELEERITNWDSKPMIADVLAKRAPFFKLYSMYSARFDSAQVAYCKWIKSSKPFAELIKVIENGPLCKGLPVSSYMLCPVQRIPRYKLLLEDYLKHLPDGHIDTENTKAALAAISEAAEHMNERISDLENQAKVVHMAKTFVGTESIVAPGRKYIGRGPVYFVPSSKRKQRVLFLFSDILLIAGITAAGRYRVHHKLPLKKLLVSVVQSPSLKNAFCVGGSSLDKPFRFCTKSAEERTKWVTELSNAKAKEEDPFVTISKSSPYSKVLDDPEAHSSILAVLNDPSFEHNQPSWVRRSLRVAPASVRRRLPLTTSAVLSQPTEPVGSVDIEEVDFSSDIVTEFEGETTLGPDKVLVAGLDNTLSSYVWHLTMRGWEKCWFVLTSRTLVCYQHHSHIIARGALSFHGFSIATPNPDEFDKRCHVVKLTRSKTTSHVFQLPTLYAYKRWTSVLEALLEPS